jgi:hypothetical protein
LALTEDQKTASREARMSAAEKKKAGNEGGDSDTVSLRAITTVHDVAGDVVMEDVEDVLASVVALKAVPKFALKRPTVVNIYMTQCD